MQTARFSALGLLLLVACGSDETKSTGSTNPWTPGSTGDEPSSTGAGAMTAGAATSMGSSEDPSDGGTATTSGVDATTAPQPGSSGETSGLGQTTGSSDYDGEPGEFVLEFDERAYRLFVPSGYVASSPIPVVVGFHGAGDDGGNFYAVAASVGLTTAAEPANYILIVPDTKSPYDDFAIWSGNPNDDVDEMLVEMDEVLSLIGDVGSHYHIDDGRLHAFGFSDGGLFTGVAGMARSDDFASLTILGYGWGSTYPLVNPGRAIPTQFGCGSEDGFYSGAVSSESFLSGQGHPTRLVTANGVGHSFTGIASALPASDMFGWMNQHAAP